MTMVSVLQEGIGERRQGHHRDAAHSLYPFLSSPNTSSQTEVLDTCQHLCFNEKPSIKLQISSDEVDGVDDGSTRLHLHLLTTPTSFPMLFVPPLPSVPYLYSSSLTARGFGARARDG